MLTVSIWSLASETPDMPRTVPARYHHGALREALLQRATELLDEEGVNAVTIRAVARNAGVTHTAPGNHFASRSALLSTLATGFFQDLESAIDVRASKVGDDHNRRARAFAQALVEFGLRHPHRYRLLWRRDLLLDDADLLAPMDAIYDKLIAELSAARRGDQKSTHTLAIGMWSMAHGYLSMRLDGNFEDRKDEVTGQSRFDALLDLIIDP
jgi:AcrR family transcriptional regulator